MPGGAWVVWFMFIVPRHGPELTSVDLPTEPPAGLSLTWQKGFPTKKWIKPLNLYISCVVMSGLQSLSGKSIHNLFYSNLTLMLGSDLYCIHLIWLGFPFSSFLINHNTYFLHNHTLCFENWKTKWNAYIYMLFISMWH
jgi:hypothetical protein